MEPRAKTTFGFQTLDVYHLATRFVACAGELIAALLLVSERTPRRSGRGQGGDGGQLVLDVRQSAVTIDPMKRTRTRPTKPRVEGRFTVVIEPCQEGGYFAECPVLAGCHVEAETYEEVVTEMRAAIRAYLEDLIDTGEPIPTGDVVVTSLNVAV